MKQPAEPVTNVPEPCRTTAVPRPGRKRNATRARVEGETAENVLDSSLVRIPQPDVTTLPRRRQKCPRRTPEDPREIPLSALQNELRFRPIQPVHLVRAGQQRRESPAALTAMEIAVEQKILRALLNQ